MGQMLSPFVPSDRSNGRRNVVHVEQQRRNDFAHMTGRPDIHCQFVADGFPDDAADAAESGAAQS